MSIIKMLILLSWSCVAASLEKVSSEWGNQEYAQLVIEYHALASRSGYMVKASEKAVGLYNTVCAQWREKLGDRVSFAQYQPVAAEERPAPIIESGPTLQSRTADYLFYNKDQMSLLGVYVCLDTVVEKLVDENVTALKNELMQVWSDSEDLLECIQQFQRDIDFSFSDQLACACAHVKSAGGAFMSRLQMADRGLYDFLCRGESVYVERLATSLSFFQPFFRIIFIDRDDSPLFYVINEARARYRALNDYTITPATSLPGKIENTSELVRKLTALKHSFDENKQDVELVTLYTGCDIDQFWTRMLKGICRHGTGMYASCASRSNLVNFFELAGVEPSAIAELCVCIAEGKPCGCCRQKNTRYMHFIQGKDVGYFFKHLLNGESHRESVDGENPEYVLQYMDFLESVGGTNWWNVLDTLMDLGCQYGQKGDQYLDVAWGKLVSVRFGLADVWEHLSAMSEKLADLPESRERLVEVVCHRLNLRFGVGSVWAEGHGVKWLFSRINRAIHMLQGYGTPDIQVENVDVSNVARVISILDRMAPNKSTEFFQFVVKCLPEAPSCIRGVEALEEGSLYRGLLEGSGTVEFLMNILSCGDKAHERKEQKKVCNILTEYLERLGFKLTAPHALGELAQVISHQQVKSGTNIPVPLELVWKRVQNSEQWRDKDMPSVSYLFVPRAQPDNRLYFCYETEKEKKLRDSQRR